MKMCTVIMLLLSIIGFNSMAGPGEQLPKPLGTTSASFGYYEYLPADYAKSEKMPLLIFLHGLGEQGNGSSELSKVLKVGPPKEIQGGRDFPFIVISPQRFNGWWHESTIDVIVDYVIDNYKVDKDRVYLTGLSSGGHGVWAYAAHYPEKVAAVVPISGTGVNQPYCELAKVPIWAFHGEDDTTVYPSNSITPVDEINKCNPAVKPKLTIYPGVGHDAWTRTYSGSAGHDIYSWMLSYSKGNKPTPPPAAPPQNQAPVVDAGEDVSLQLPENTVTLQCSASDADGSIASYSWKKVSGPAVVLNGDHSSSVKVASLNEGDYTFQVEVTDDAGATAHDEVKLTVMPSSGGSAGGALPEGDCGCDHIVTADMPIVSPATLGTVKPGDVICLQAGVRDYVAFKDLKGTASAPITIKNCGGLVQFENDYRAGVISFSECKYFRFTGSGSSGLKYGIKVAIGGKDTAIRYGGGCTEFEIDHVEVADAGFAGIMIKSDPMCQYPQYQRGNFTMNNVLVHDNYIHDVYGEGIYIGHYAYNGLETADCGTIYPHDINNLKVYNNITRNTGADGIQVACNPIGTEIYDNLIEDYGNEPFAAYQANGLIVGQQSKVYNNVIRNGKGDGAGMQVFGAGGHVVYNNLIINSPHAGIFCDERTNEIDGAYHFFNNTIINSGAGGILLYGEKVPNNYVKNNLIIDAQGKYIVLLNSTVKIEKSNNYTSTKVSDAGFVNASAGDYHLKASSASINAGVDVSSYGVKFDMDRVARPYDGIFDIGAYEAKVTKPTDPTPPPPAGENGLTYSYYEGSWNKLPDFSKQKVVKSGKVSNFDLSPRNRNDNFGFRFDGFLEVTKAGEYTFFTSSDDGSNLYVNGKHVVKNDGLHASQERSGKITLSEGLHAIKVKFFEKTGNEVLVVKYAGPGISKQTIPTSVLYTTNTTGGGTPPVSEVNDYGILVNFNQYDDQSGNWNNVASHPQHINPLTNMVDENGEDTGVSIDFISDWDGVNEAGVVSGNNSGVFPDNVMKTAYVISTTATMQFKLTNLEPSWTYKLVFFGSRSGSGDRTTIYKAGGKSVSLNAAFNSETVALENLKSNASGELMVEVSKASTASYGYLNAMVIIGDNPNVSNNRVAESSFGKNGSLQEALTEINDTEQLSVAKAFPNPATDKVFVVIPEQIYESDYKVTLLGNTGEEITNWDKFQLNQTSSQVELGIQELNLSPGIYFLRIESPSVAPETIRVFIK